MSATVLTANEQPPKKIDIDFSSARRTSFLPDVLLNESDSIQGPSSLKGVKILECHEDDEVFSSMYVKQAEFEHRALKRFCTGSKYLGQWSKLGIAGKGIYKYPHGVIYDGYFNRNGEFHGTGILVYPNGQKIEGIWRNGKLGDNSNFVTKAGIVMNKNYCMLPDRRFQIEFENDFNPPGEEYLTNQMPPPRNIPHDCYDLVEGFYDPRVKTVYAHSKDGASNMHVIDSKQSMFSGRKSANCLRKESKYPDTAVEDEYGNTNSNPLLNEMLAEGKFGDTREISWIPTALQENWITHNCRKAWDEATGYRPDLYEEWTKGSSDLQEETGATSDEKHKSILCKLALTEKKTDPNKADEPQFYSFIQTKKDDQEMKTLNTLRKMFLGKPIDLADVETRDRVLSLISESYDLPTEKA
ncbi:uncharacterized protein LOC109538233 [Dendroctonus ponderosae]|uniref:MORN repeat-containing protein 5 n=1 Tax=Dendroctonus ponderosae TaxID=77166 RepID=U4UFC3_DENPD|nr:uncharacterized protein LOC109538233 [Dendroctonus ponderosae]ERL91038.1 hypothetical protein D910_08380 [Dendroctonus ponderosae]